MSNEYQLADGSPRYGHRTEAMTAEKAAPAPTVRAEEAAEGAARLSLDHMAAAIDRRLTRSWSDTKDPLMEALHADHPEEVMAAKALVKLHLGTQKQWRMKAQAVRDRNLEDTVRRRKASGLAAEVLFLRVGLLLALASLPIYVVVTSRDDLLKLIVTGLACIAVAAVGGYALTVRERVPVMPNIRGPWLNELREDIVNATLVAILQNKGVELDAKTAAAGRRGWESIKTASKAVDCIHN